MRSLIVLLATITCISLILTFAIPVHGEWATFHRDLNRSGFDIGEAGPSEPSIHWQFETGAYVYASPVLADGKIFIGSGDETFYCIDATTGDEIWSFATGGVIQGTATHHDGRVFIPSYDDNLYCRDANTGDEIWTASTGGDIFSSPAVDSGRVVFGCTNGRVYCLDASDGSTVWHFQTSAPVFTSAAIEDGLVYIGSGTTYYCLNLDTPVPVWTSVLGESIISTAAVQFQEVYVATGGNNLQGTLYLLDGRTGQPLWTYQDEEGANFFSSPAISERMVVIGSDSGRVHCVERDSGAFQWSYLADAMVQSSPAIIGDLVYVGCDDGYVHCLDVDGGLLVWKLRISEEQVRSSPAVEDGRLWIGAWDGFVTCIGNSGEEPGGDGQEPISVLVVEPSSSNMNADTSFTITCEIEANDVNDTLTLWYAPERNESLIEQIVKGSVGTITGSYRWDTDLVPEGSYWIKAEIESGGLVVSNWSSGTVLIRHGSDDDGDDEFIPIGGGAEMLILLSLGAFLRRRR